jgi:hypothetical protein
MRYGLQLAKGWKFIGGGIARSESKRNRCIYYQSKKGMVRSTPYDGLPGHLEMALKVSRNLKRAVYGAVIVPDGAGGHKLVSFASDRAVEV